MAAWNLKPEAPGPVTQFSHVLPEGQAFSSTSSTNIAVSPDGSRMVYVANGQLYVRAMDSLDSTPIPGSDEAPRDPFFSPDGQWIGYWSLIDSQLKKIAVGGGAPVTLSDAEDPLGSPFWGTDDMIVWGQSAGILRLSANGGTPEVLIPEPAGNIGRSQILPGGSSVLLTRNGQEVVLHSLESGEQKVLFAGRRAR